MSSDSCSVKKVMPHLGSTRMRRERWRAMWLLLLMKLGERKKIKRMDATRKTQANMGIVKGTQRAKFLSGLSVCVF